MLKRIIPSLGFLLLVACSQEPEMHLPVTDAPADYKEAGNWVKAAPAIDQFGKTWWTAFANTELDGLEARVEGGNQTLKQALARLDEAQANVDVSHSGLLPQVSLGGNAGRNELSNSLANNAPNRTYNNYGVNGTVSFETDLWGRVRSQVNADTSRLKASADDLAVADLSIRAELAQQYFMLRGYDEQQHLLDETVADYQKAYNLTTQRHDGGIALASDVSQAETQLDDAKTRAAANHMKRAQAEHAIAVLIGTLPSSFSLPDGNMSLAVPMTSPGMPATLLERRPDVAAAERQMEAANAEIGVAKAAYFPDLTLTGQGGYESTLIHSLFDAPSLLWAFGAAVTMPLFDGGRIDGLTHAARARYDQAVAGYRQTVLTSYQEVEDNLIALHQLDTEAQTQQAAADAAQKTLDQTRNRYEGGVTNYLDVVIAQNTALDAKATLINIRTQRLIAAVNLIKALGGGWTTTPSTTPTPSTPSK